VLPGGDRPREQTCEESEDDPRTESHRDILTAQDRPSTLFEATLRRKGGPL
jgi:hypothetical protein